MRERTNLRGRAMLRSALVLIPTTAVVVGLTGFSAGPALELTGARAALELARSRADRLAFERTYAEAIDRAQGFERIERAQQGLDRLIPRGVSDLDLYTALRLSAETQGLQVETLRLGATRDPGHTRTHEMAELQSFELSARGSLDRFLATLTTVEELGLPVRVLELSLRRRDPDSASFEIHASLGLYRLVPAPADDPANEEETP